ncbi:DUF4012 domain-containing protein [Promicromonospora panici]|uniref:DUF4012 domain-containing protein n=1 Tax=Promicromonospora panici TaxID=2219658 RepID=UPI00101C897C|nr:DUF4012 domain-containing protein [Promicromonospora panici]
MAGIFVLLAIVIGWVAFDAMRARVSLEQAADGVATLQADAVAGRTEDLDKVVADLQQDTAEAKVATSGPHWAIAENLPGVGPTVEAVATMSDVVDGLAQGALPDMARIVELANPAAFAPHDGRIDLEPLQQVAPDMQRADQSIGYARERVDGLGGTMLPPVSDAVEQLSGALTELRMTSATAARAAAVIPSMLGADEPQDWLVLVQNPAEPRALGGIPGTVIALRADQGEVELTEQMPGIAVGPFDEPVLPLTAEEQQVLGDEELGRWMRNVTMTPDFPRAAELAQEMWRLETGQTVDGVMTIDPVVLADLVQVDGPIDAGPGGMLEGGDLVSYLLNGIYKTERPEVQDRIFATMAERSFARLVAGQGDALGMIDSLAESARQGRLLLWSADEEVNRRLQGTVLDGSLRGDGDRPVVGVFTQGIDTGKIGYYLDTAVEVAERDRRPDGSRELAVTVTYTSRVKASEVEGLPEYLTGRGTENPGNVRLFSLVYAPNGGSMVHSEENGVKSRLSPQSHDGLSLATQRVELAPGETTSMTYVMITGKQEIGDLILRTTPGTRPVGVTIENSSLEQED